MAVQTETVSSIADLITKLNTWMQTVGWTSEHLDVTTDSVTGGEWAMRFDRPGSNVRFACSWDADSLNETRIALYHYVDQNYVIGDRPWGQDNDSGNGLQASAPDADITDERSVILTNTPIRYWAFSNDFGVSVVVEITPGEVAHFGFGLFDKRGTWVGGSYVYGHRNSGAPFATTMALTDSSSWLIDGFFNDTADAGGLSSGSELIAATIHCEGLPSQPVGGKFAVSMGGPSEADHQAVFGNDRQTVPVARVNFTWGLRSGPFTQVHRMPFSASGSLPPIMQGNIAMWRIAPTYVDGGDIHGTPIAFMRDVFGLSINPYRELATIIDDDAGEKYYLFPAHKKYSGTGSEIGTSGYLGIAYRVENEIDPQFVAERTAHWDASNDESITLVAGKVSQIDDLANSSDFAQGTASMRPTLIDIGGMQMLNFDDDNDEHMVATDNANLDLGSGACSFFVVYKCDEWTWPGGDAKSINTLFAKGYNPAVGRYRIGMSFEGSQDTIFGYVDTGGDGSPVIDTSENFADGTLRLCTISINRVTERVDVWSDGVETSFSDTVDTSAVGSTDSSQDLYLGKFFAGASADDFNLAGQIGELIIFKGQLSDAQIDGINNYLLAKWGI